MTIKARAEQVTLAPAVLSSFNCYLHTWSLGVPGLNEQALSAYAWMAKYRNSLEGPDYEYVTW